MFIIIEGKPQAAERPRSSRNGHFYTPKKTIDAEQRIADKICEKAMAKLDGPVALQVTFYLKRPKKGADGLVWNQKKPDIDNLIKTVMDGITKSGRVWVDDSQVVMLEARKFYTIDVEKTVIQVAAAQSNMIGM